MHSALGRASKPQDPGQTLRSRSEYLLLSFRTATDAEVDCENIAGLTKPKQLKAEQVPEDAKDAIREICYLCWINGVD